VGEACGDLGVARALVPTALACAALRNSDQAQRVAVATHVQSSHERVVVALSPMPPHARRTLRRPETTWKYPCKVSGDFLLDTRTLTVIGVAALAGLLLLGADTMKVGLIWAGAVLGLHAGWRG
jgi:hypothetical protein